MLELLYNKKRELENELIKLDEAVEKTEAKLDLISEIIKEEEAKAPAEASCEVNPIAAKAEKPIFDPLVHRENNSTVFISYSNDLG